MAMDQRPNRSHYEKISEGARNAILGTHTRSGMAHATAGYTGGSSKKARKGIAAGKRASARHGEINQVLPQTSSRESNRQYYERISRRDYTDRLVAKQRHRGLIMGLGIVFSVICIALMVAVFAFVHSTNDKIEIKDDSLYQVIADTPIESDGTFWLLMAASLGESADNAADELMLVRMDPQNHTAITLAIPGNAYVTLPSGSKGLLNSLDAVTKPGTLVSAVEQFAGVDIHAYAHISADGLVELVDSLDGIEVTIPEEVDDPSAGSLFLSAGEQVLDGQEALYWCRAKNYVGGQQSRSRNIAQVSQVLMSKVAAQGTWGLVAFMDDFADAVNLSMGVPNLFDYLPYAASLTRIQDRPVGVMPGVVQKLDGQQIVVPQEDAWLDMVDRVSAGQEPDVDSSAIVDAVDKNFTISINNGSGITGAAGAAQDILTNRGFTVESIGNTSASVYEETLIVYKDDKFASQAEALVAALGNGRPVYNSVHYDFDTDVMIVIGTDWVID